MRESVIAKLRLTLFGGLCGLLTGTSIAVLSWLTTGSFFWYAWVFSPLILFLCGVAFVAWWQRSRWLEETPLVRQFSALLGKQFARSAVLLFLVLLSLSGVAVGAMPWIIDHRSTEAYRIDGFRKDPKYYSQLVLDLKSEDESARTIALGKIGGDNSAPKIDVLELRMTMFAIAEDAKEGSFIREMAVKALGRAGLAEDIPRLESILEQTKGIEQERGISDRCRESIDELRNPSKYRWNP